MGTNVTQSQPDRHDSSSIAVPPEYHDGCRCCTGSLPASAMNARVGLTGCALKYKHANFCCRRLKFRFRGASTSADRFPPRASKCNRYNRGNLLRRGPKIGICTIKSAKNAFKVLAFRQFLQLKTVKRRKVRYVWHPQDAESQEAHWKLILWTADPCWVSIESSGHTAIIQDDRLTRDWTC
jgi:hypothetical protein